MQRDAVRSGCFYVVYGQSVGGIGVVRLLTKLRDSVETELVRGPSVGASYIGYNALKYEVALTFAGWREPKP